MGDIHDATQGSPTGGAARTLEEELRGTQDPTHFGRILQELGIGYIAAHSPQAKGRIERFWQTLQDRLVSELRLRGSSTLEAANAFLPAFLADLNPRFAGAPPTPARLPTRVERRAATRMLAPPGNALKGLGVTLSWPSSS